MRGIAHLCDHRAVLYRATVTRDSFGDTIETWVAQSTPGGLNCRPNQSWSGTLQDPGAGEQQRANRQWFLITGWEPRERDLLKIVAGPEAGTVVRIVSVTRPTASREVNHLEVNVEPWTGVTP